MPNAQIVVRKQTIDM